MKHNRTRWYIHLIFILCTLTGILPLLLVVIISFTDENTLMAGGYSFFPEKFSLGAYKYLLLDPDTIVRAYGVTIFITITGTLLCLMITSALAYPLSRKDMPLKRGMTLFVFFTVLFNGGLVPWYLVYTNLLSLQDNIWSLIIPGLLMNGFNVLVMRTFFAATIPFELLEAANMDGAGELRIFLQIVVPLSKPAYATIGLFATLAYWNDWYNSMVFLINAKNFSMQYLLNRILINMQFLVQNTRNSNSSTAMASLPRETVRMAMAVIAAGPVLLAYPFFQQYFVKGLTIGAVKG